MNEIKRRHLQPEKKFEIVKEAITSKLTVSEVCKTHGINTSLYYKWLQAFFNGALGGNLSHLKEARQWWLQGKFMRAEKNFKNLGGPYLWIIY